MKKTLYILALSMTFQVFSQTECENNLAGTYPCNGFDLMSQIAVSTLANNLGSPEGADIWGWTDPSTQKEYAIAAMTNSTAFVDISDPINPVFLGRLDTANGRTNFWRDVKVYNNHAFIVADLVGSHGMQVFDLTRLRGITSPQSWTADALFTGVGSCHNIVINENAAMAYLVGCNTFSGGIHFVDISDPKNPTDAGGYSADGYTHDAQVVTYNGPDSDYTGKEIYIGSNEDEVVILDVTNPSNVVKIAEVSYPQIGYTHQGWFTEDQKYFILGDELDERDRGFNTRTIFFDFTDLDNPQYHTAFEGSTAAIDHNGYVIGNEYYMANYTRGVVVFDITSINNTSNPMTEIGYFDTYPSNNGTSFNGAWSVYPYFASGNIIINDINRGLFVIRKSGTLSTDNPVLSSEVKLFPNPVLKDQKLTLSVQGLIQTLEIYDVLGKQVLFLGKIDKSSYELPVENLQTGVYFVRINQTRTAKFIVE